MNTYKLGSLFDGSGGFPLAGSLCGITPVWAAEVEPYPIAVTRSRFPNMKHLGDISKVNGAEIEPVDIITFGSPCQDLSVAGKRAGLKHTENGDEETTRSGLFMEAVRIIKEMREATGGKFPRWALWENVPGAFSSNKGEDFRVVCEELIKIVEPNAVMPGVPKGGWAYADSYRGAGWSLAYRVLDAQYWGVPQRRRRIYLIADFGGECAREVLFEREGLRGYFAEGRTPWKGTAADAENSVGADDRKRNCVGVLASSCKNAEVTDGKISPCLMARAGTGGNQLPLIAVATQQGGAEISENGVCPTITAAAGMSGNNQPWICSLEPGIAAREGGHIYEGVFGTLRANAGDNQMAVAYGFDGYNSTETGDKAATLGVNCGMSTGRNGVVVRRVGNCIIDDLVLDDQGGQQISVRNDGKSPTLRAEMHGNVPCVMEAGFCPEESAKTRGVGYAEEQAPTLRAGATPAVCYSAAFCPETGGNDPSRSVAFQMELSPTLRAGAVPAVCAAYDARGNGDGCVCNTITGDHNNRITDYSTVVCCCIDGDNIGEAERCGGSALGIREGHKKHTLTAKAAGTHAVCVPIQDQATRFAGKRGDKQDGKGNGLGVGVSDDPMYTLTEGDRHAVAYSMETFHCTSEEEKVSTLKARDYKDPSVVCYGVDCRNSTEYPESMGAIQAAMNHNLNSNGVVRVQYIVRRLTPIECARLQGFADCWGELNIKEDFSPDEYRFWLDVRNTHAAINGKAVKDYTKEQMLNWYNKLHTDSSEYKMWGNGIALPTALYVMQGIADVLYRKDVKND